MLRLALLLLSLVAPLVPAPSRAAGTSHEPPREPMLRVEAGGHIGGVPHLALDRSGRLLATAGYDKTVRLWSLESGAQIAVLRPPIGDREEGEIYAVALSPDGGRVYAAGATGWQWDATFSVYVFDAENPQLTRPITDLQAPVSDLAVSPDGRLLAVGLFRGGVQVWEIGGEPRRVFADRAYAGPLRGLTWGGGRLFATGEDGRVRAYDAAGRKLAEIQPAPGLHPRGVAASPSGELLAVTYRDATRVDVLSAASLAHVFRPDTSGLTGEGLLAVAWSPDGCCSAQLLVAGYARAGEHRVIRRWADYGRGAHADVPAARDTILALAPVPGGGAVYGTEDPGWGRLSADGRVVQSPRPPIADLRLSREGGLAVSEDGTVVEVATAGGRLRFDASARRLAPVSGESDPRLARAIAGAPGLQVEGWRDGSAPRLNGVPLAFDQSEFARSLAVLPDGGGVLLGTDTWLRLYARDGRLLAQEPIPVAAWAVTISADRRVAVAALLDGTLRWYGLDPDAPLQPRAALFASTDGERWVLYTPEGLFDHADTGGQTLVGIHLNRGAGQLPEWTTLSQAYRILYARDAVLARLRGDPGPLRARLAELGDLRRRLLPRPSLEVTQACVPQAGDACAAVATMRGAVARLPNGATRLRLKVHAEDRGLGMGVIDVFVNRRNAGRFPPPAFSGTNAEPTVEVPLDTGENVVQVRMYDGAGRVFAEAAPLRVAVPTGADLPEPAHKGRLFVLAVGVNRFARPELNLRSAVEDAEDFAGLFRRTTASPFLDVEVTTLLDEEATRTRIVERLDRIAATARPDDTFLFYVASYGAREVTGGRVLLFPYDVGDPARKDTLARSTLDEENLIAMLSRVRARNALLLLDVCHAGELAIEDLAGLGQETGRDLLVASNSVQEALDSRGGRNGVFLTAVREALQGKAPRNRDGTVEALSLGEYVSRRVRQLAQERGHVHDAVFHTAGRDPHFFPVAVPEPAASARRP